MSDDTKRVVCAFIAGILVGIGLFALAAEYGTPSNSPCLPADATNYDGAGVWYNDDGQAVALAENEDTLIWCDGRTSVDDTVRP